jgi:hypothetical protein
MAFQMSLRDDDTYTYIKNNLVFESGAKFGAGSYKVVSPYDLYGGKYYSWTWDDTDENWILVDEESELYAETDFVASTYVPGYSTNAPSPIIPYNGYGYFCTGEANAVKVKKIDFSTNNVSTVATYSVTHDGICETDASVYGNYAFFVVGVADDAGDSATEVSLEVLKMSLIDESITQLYTSDDTLDSSYLGSVGVGCDGTDVFFNCHQRDPYSCLSVPIGGGGTTNIGDSSQVFYGERGWARYESKIFNWRTSVAGDQKEWAVPGTRMNEYMIVYIMDDSTYPVYAITGTSSGVYAVTLNSDESVTTVETLCTGSYNSRVLAYPLTILYGKNRSVLFFPANSGENSVEIRLPYRDVL